jgi:hypothetical protein
MSYASILPLGCSMKINFDAQENVLGRHVWLKDSASAKIVRIRLNKRETADTLSALPESLRGFCLGVSKSSIHAFGPHVHTKEECTINFYYKTNGETTVFYDGECIVDDAAATDNGNSYHMVKPDLLTKALTYVASDGDVWLLNTKKPHAVIGDNQAPRHILQVHMAIPYEQVLEHFAARSSDVSQTRLAA